MNTYFYKSFLRKVRSHLGELARLTGPAHLHMNSPLLSLNHFYCFRFLYVMKTLFSLDQVYFMSVNHRFRTSRPGVLLGISTNSQENTCVRKETLRQVFSCVFCEISKNAFFHWLLLQISLDQRSLIFRDVEIQSIFSHKFLFT